MYIKRARNRITSSIALASLLCLLNPSVGLSIFDLQDKNSGRTEKPEGILMEIYHEVRELGYRDEEDFIKREFHFNLDGIWANREEHIMILSHKEGDGERMILQVTYFGEAANKHFVRYSESIREIMCHIEGDALQIRECGYDEFEIRALLPEILEGIRSEKELLRSIRHKK
jgi:hypothetical protein